MENNNNNNDIKRRDLMKGLAAVPFLGLFSVGAAAKYMNDQELKESILKELDIDAATPPPTGSMAGDPIRIGVIGFGIRGEQLVRALGYATPQWKEMMKERALANSKDTRLRDFLDQENLNIKITAVCDAFSRRREWAQEAGMEDGNKPKIYVDYKELLQDPNVDAVVISTPDHWHAPMSIDAINAGKHVYVEKCMTHKVQETYDLYDAVKNSQIVFQLGHQHRQTQSFLTAQEIIKKNVLGHISLIQTNTNRNDDNGAWQYHIHEDANQQTIDWANFLGNAPDPGFNLEHFFRWRKWWEYGTGLTGDLLTHDYDRVNCLLNMGIPDAVVCSGGVYTHRDGRTVPDVLQVVMEYNDYFMGGSQDAGKEKGMTFIYSATLGNQFSRPTLLMGHDATLELGSQLTVYPDARSTRYKDMLQEEMLNTGTPMYAYNPAAKGVDGVTGATAKYFADKGLMWTYRDGKRVDSTFLHMREWLSAIRNGHGVSCGIEEGFEEAISAHMSTIAYRLGKRVDWDKENRIITNVTQEELESIGIA
jgi:predicted dehydrogenase